jgi:uncharacterized protein YdeI (YjbR/CyaY-like superfamily)
MRHTKKMTQFITLIVAKKRKKTMSRDLEDFDNNILLGVDFAEQVTRACDLFWSNNKLGYDKDGKIIRTDEKRIRPRDFRDMITAEVLNKKAVIEHHLNKNEKC